MKSLMWGNSEYVSLKMCLLLNLIMVLTLQGSPLLLCAVIGSHMSSSIRFYYPPLL